MGSEIQRTDSSNTPVKTAIHNHHQNSSGSSSSPTLSSDKVAELPISIDEHDVQAGARQVLHSIRPSWRDEDIQLKVSASGPMIMVDKY